jgi:hypothetical protein
MQDDRATNPAEAGPSAIERVQRELAETRATLQGETAHIGQLQQALEQALQVARSVRLEAINELDRLAGELMDAARRDAAAIRARAEDDARAVLARADEEIRTLRTQADEEIRAQRAAAEAAAAEQRAAIERRVHAAQAELERMQTAWATAAQALTDARRNLVADVGDALSGVLGGAEAGAPPVAPVAAAAAAPPPSAAAPPPPAVEEPAAVSPAPAAEESSAQSEPITGERLVRPTAAAMPGWEVTGASMETSAPAAEPPAPAASWGASPTPAEPAESEPEAAEPQEITRFDLSPVEVAEAHEAAEGIELGWSARQEITEDLTAAKEALGERAGTLGWEDAEREALYEGPSGSPLEQAGQQLRAGDVAGALDTYRGIVDRSPEEVEGVIARLTLMLQDAVFRSHHEEVRLLLVDAYMVQGDYDRAMSLLHEPAS